MDRGSYCKAWIAIRPARGKVSSIIAINVVARNAGWRLRARRIGGPHQPRCRAMFSRHRRNYVAQFGDAAMDASLPKDGAKGRLVRGARGPKEDAEIQYEFARLFLDGDILLVAGLFQTTVPSGIAVQGQKDNVPGLEIADLIARPCGDKVLDPTSTPARWEQMKTQLCTAVATKHSILGLKITPLE